MSVSVWRSGPGGLVLADDAAEMRAGQRDRWRMHEGRAPVCRAREACSSGLVIS